MNKKELFMWFEEQKQSLKKSIEDFKKETHLSAYDEYLKGFAEGQFELIKQLENFIKNNKEIVRTKDDIVDCREWEGSITFFVEGNKIVEGESIVGKFMYQDGDIHYITSDITSDFEYIGYEDDGIWKVFKNQYDGEIDLTDEADGFIIREFSIGEIK